MIKVLQVHHVLHVLHTTKPLIVSGIRLSPVRIGFCNHSKSSDIYLHFLYSFPPNNCHCETIDKEHGWYCDDHEGVLVHLTCSDTLRPARVLAALSHVWHCDKAQQRIGLRARCLPAGHYVIDWLRIRYGWMTQCEVTRISFETFFKRAVVELEDERQASMQFSGKRYYVDISTWPITG